MLFTLHGLGHQAGKVLQLLKSSLEALGAQCRADSAGFSLSANLPDNPPHELGSSTPDATSGKAAALQAGSTSGLPHDSETNGGDVNPADLAEVGPSGPPEAGAAFPMEQQTCTDQSLQNNSAIGPKGPPAPVSATASHLGQNHLESAKALTGPDMHKPGSKGKAQRAGCSMKLVILQQPGQGRVPELVVKASIPAQTSDAEAQQFTSVMGHVEQDLRILLAN